MQGAELRRVRAQLKPAVKVEEGSEESSGLELVLETVAVSEPDAEKTLRKVLAEWDNNDCVQKWSKLQCPKKYRTVTLARNLFEAKWNGKALGKGKKRKKWFEKNVLYFPVAIDFLHNKNLYGPVGEALGQGR